MKRTVLSGLAALVSVCLPGALHAATANYTVTPTSIGVFDSNHAISVPGDPAPGFPMGSIASNGGGKTDAYFTPENLFRRAVTVGEVAAISYFTRTGATHTAVPRDWALVLYTAPYANDASTPEWYGDRYGAEPYLAANLTDPADAWNQWTTTAGPNQLRFYESTEGATGASFGTYEDPVWTSFIAQPALSGQPRGTQRILYFSLQTGADWAEGFEGRLDGLTITLTDGSVARVNFEADATDTDNDGVPDHLDHALNSDMRLRVDVNGPEPGETTVPNITGDDGVTIQDLVNECAATARNHGGYVSCITNLTNELRASGFITQQQAAEMRTAASQSSIGNNPPPADQSPGRK